MPIDPLPYWVFVPYIYNPAIVGSKDFLSLDFNAAFRGKSNTQIISGNTRLLKTKTGYFTSPDIVEFKNIGFGGSLFDDANGSFRNIGASVAVSYQIPITARKLSFLSAGVSFKGVYNIVNSSSEDPGSISKKTFSPDLDLGVYYFGPNFFTGLSSTNLLGNPEDKDRSEIYNIPVFRQYFFTAGFKFLLSRSLNIVLEPSAIIMANDSTFMKIPKNFNPVLKIYLADFCFGTDFFNKDETTLFFQYKYSRFYAGAFFELPKKTPYFKRAPYVEITTGINIQIDKSGFTRHSKW